MTASKYDIEDALWSISPDCSHDEWYRIAAAIYDALGDDGFDLFDQWSSYSQTKYPGRRACRRQWDHSKRLTKITVGTLFFFAKQHRHAV